MSDKTVTMEINEKTPLYKNGGQKIIAEADAQYEKAKGKESAEMMKAQMTPIIQYITEKCETDTEYNTLVLQPHKTWERCYKFMMDKAQKMAATGSTGLLVEGMTILKWIDEYYKLDDKVQVDKEVAENAKKKQKIKEDTEKTKTHKPAVVITKVDSKKEDISDNPKAGKKKSELDGQFSLFDMM